MEKLELICNLIVTLIGVIPTVISLFVLIKNIIVNKNWDIIVNMAKEAMSTVEKYAATHPEITSKQKLDMALEAIEAGCATAGIALDAATIERIIAYISEMCKWSKTVNIDGK